MPPFFCVSKRISAGKCFYLNKNLFVDIAGYDLGYVHSVIVIVGVEILSLLLCKILKPDIVLIELPAYKYALALIISRLSVKLNKRPKEPLF